MINSMPIWDTWHPASKRKLHIKHQDNVLGEPERNNTDLGKNKAENISLVAVHKTWKYPRDTPKQGCLWWGREGEQGQKTLSLPIPVAQTHGSSVWWVLLTEKQVSGWGCREEVFVISIIVKSFQHTWDLFYKNAFYWLRNSAQKSGKLQWSLAPQRSKGHQVMNDIHSQPSGWNTGAHVCSFEETDMHVYHSWLF